MSKKKDAVPADPYKKLCDALGIQKSDYAIDVSTADTCDQGAADLVVCFDLDAVVRANDPRATLAAVGRALKSGAMFVAALGMSHPYRWWWERIPDGCVESSADVRAALGENDLGGAVFAFSKCAAGVEGARGAVEHPVDKKGLESLLEDIPQHHPLHDTPDMPEPEVAEDTGAADDD